MFKVEFTMLLTLLKHLFFMNFFLPVWNPHAPKHPVRALGSSSHTCTLHTLPVCLSTVSHWPLLLHPPAIDLTPLFIITQLGHFPQSQCSQINRLGSDQRQLLKMQIWLNFPKAPSLENKHPSLLHILEMPPFSTTRWYTSLSFSSSNFTKQKLSRVGGSPNTACCLDLWTFSCCVLFWGCLDLFSLDRKLIHTLSCAKTLPDYPRYN